MVSPKMFTLCYYAAIILLLNVYYAAINLSCYYAAVILLFKIYYANIMLLLCGYYCLLGSSSSSANGCRDIGAIPIYMAFSDSMDIVVILLLVVVVVLY